MLRSYHSKYFSQQTHQDGHCLKLESQNAGLEISEKTFKLVNLQPINSLVKLTGVDYSTRL